MQFDQPIDGELWDFEPRDDDDEGMVYAAEELMNLMRQMIVVQQQQLQAMAILSQQVQAFMAAPRRVIRDESGRVIGAQIEG